LLVSILPSSVTCVLVGVQLPPFGAVAAHSPSEYVVIIATSTAVRGASARSRSVSLPVERDSNNFRINVWAAVVEMIRDRPILGIGSGSTAFNKIYPSTSASF